MDDNAGRCHDVVRMLMLWKGTMLRVCYNAALLLAGLVAGLAGAELAHDDPAQRAALPEFRTIPAATPDELTSANGWPATDALRGWSRSLGGPTSDRYSALTQITRANVAPAGRLDMEGG